MLQLQNDITRRAHCGLHSDLATCCSYRTILQDVHTAAYIHINRNNLRSVAVANSDAEWLGDSRNTGRDAESCCHDLIYSRYSD
jgi:hypothetical protein